MSLKGKLGARVWAANFEQSLHASDKTVPVYHCHAYLIWTDGVGVDLHSLDSFVFEGIRPRVDVCQLKWGKGGIHRGALHGLWYVSQEKSGTLHAATNYPAGPWYKPSAAWLEGLYQDNKLTLDRFIQLSATNFPFGHATRKRDVEEALRDRRKLEVEALVARELKELEDKDALQKLQTQTFPDIDLYIQSFKCSKRRRPVLLILGATGLGKSLMAGQILEKIGEILGLSAFLEITVEDDGHLDFSELDPSKHAGVLLDGLGDLLLLKRNRETLQGRPKVLKGGRSQTMRYAYPFTLARRGVVVTMDLSATNLHLLDCDHWLSKSKNICVVRLVTSPWQQSAPSQVAPAEERMKSWTADEVVRFLMEKDLEGPSRTLFANGVRGRDLFQLTVDSLKEDLKLSSFAAHRVLEARREFLDS